MQAWGRFLLCGVFLTVLLGCGAAEPEVAHVTMPPGDGEGASSTLTEVKVANSQGQAYAAFAYDTSYWTAIYAQESQQDDVLLVVSNAQGTVTITAMRTLGRADTTCRYQMALAARDEGYAIGDYNWQTNPHQVEFFVGEITKNQGGRAYYCAQVWNNFGVEFLLSADRASTLDKAQLLYLMRSLEALR